jgi:hypothetical protein
LADGNAAANGCIDDCFTALRKNISQSVVGAEEFSQHRARFRRIMLSLKG